MDSQDILDSLMAWVRIDTPTGDVQGIAKLVDLIQSQLAPLGCEIERIAGRDGMGDHLVARFRGGDGPGVLVTSHIDTVCAPGTVPIRRDGDRQYGPGIADMKGGGYLALCAMRDIVETGTPLPGPVTLIYNLDEEIGAPTSHQLIQAEARKMGAALIPEPARGDEAITFRKGRAKYTLEFHGVQSHAGSAFADGRSAILQMARTIGQLEAMTDLATETTVNVGRVRGGTEPNVVAGYAACDIDVRFADDALGLAVEDALKALTSDDPAVTITLSGEIEKPCLARTLETLAMFARAAEINTALGAPMVEARSGGGSDGNFTCAAGVPTLDGLGAIGNNWHSPAEHILVTPLARRMALLRALILTYAGTRPNGETQ
ncbi:M20 family metallopeptidase [Tropicibacter naphthalenivorans]|uniref:Carboxypeptidase G2 n=1 Tax=Tropicibacter naphthalenivorans TaxID=441103 RepID=A0A0P1GXR0_9RHOB|nr:M20 family metallopeptidase [Tropicibacter naphthalenivorans]CUH80669.1 Carboxypeptidase G2 precursor [Tropicibacter naphthalenivorans]SMC89252.1 glutamate carboxypeptidase [Tropicibacter naphthalenivorans]